MMEVGWGRGGDWVNFLRASSLKFLALCEDVLPVRDSAPPQILRRVRNSTERSCSQTRLDLGTNLMRVAQWGSLDGWNTKTGKDEGTGDCFMVDRQ